MRLAVSLEAYASSCLDFIYKNSNAQRHPDEQYPDWDVSLPDVSPYPDDTDGWKALDRRLAGECLNLRNKVHESQGLINSTIEYTPDDLEYELDRQAAKRGLEAWRLAARLRTQHGVEPADTEWDVAGELERKLKRAEDADRQSRERSSELMEAMAGGPPKSS